MAQHERFEVSLPPDLAEYVHAQVGKGTHASDNEVMLALVRDAKRREARLAELRSAWDEGIASGNAGPLDFEEIKRKGREKLAAIQAQRG